MRKAKPQALPKPRSFRATSLWAVLIVSCLSLLFSEQVSRAAGSPSGLNCKAGPVKKTFGKTQWLVYGCDDKHTLIVVAAPGNRAFPFYFVLSPAKGGYHLTGEGTGDKAETDAAYRDLSTLSDRDIAALLAGTKH